METRDGLSFNCAESVMIGVSRKVPLPGFDASCMRIASILGGGVGGSGEICGAVSGASACIGLIYGTDGTEEPDEFDRKRTLARSLVNQMVSEFTEKWGTVRCRLLKAMDKGEMNPAGTAREKPYARDRCDEYVAWTANWLGNVAESVSPSSDIME
jgi:C_GCAxxG_C_C family probable redox protein